VFQDPQASYQSGAKKTIKEENQNNQKDAIQEEVKKEAKKLEAIN
jgi:hypothetical protein